MEYRVDPRTGNRISALGFGCMRLPGEKESERLILNALEGGINYFDTAYAYAGNEPMLGRIIERNGIRDRMYIATKIPHGKVHSLDDASELLATSLKRLQTDYVDYYLIHNLATFAQWERLLNMGIAKWIEAARACGYFKQIGFSFHGTMPEFTKIMDSFDWDFCQIQYNYINEHYQGGREALEMATRRGMAVIIMEPLLGGRLAAKLPKDAEKAFCDYAPNASFASWGLRWLWDQPQATCVLSGMNTPEQLDDNIAVASACAPGSLSDDERAVIERAKAAFEKVYRIPCTGCNYCMPCPKGISIPSTFTAYNESFALGWFTGVFHYMLSAGVGDEGAHFPSDCVGCGACVAKCPQHIEIPVRLKEASRRLQPPGVKPAAAILGKVRSR